MAEEKLLIGELNVHGSGGCTSPNKLRISAGLGQVMAQEAKGEFVSQRIRHPAHHRSASWPAPCQCCATQC